MQGKSPLGVCHPVAPVSQTMCVRGWCGQLCQAVAVPSAQLFLGRQRLRLQQTAMGSCCTFNLDPRPPPRLYCMNVCVLGAVCESKEEIHQWAINHFLNTSL